MELKGKNLKLKMQIEINTKIEYRFIVDKQESKSFIVRKNCIFWVPIAPLFFIVLQIAMDKLQPLFWIKVISQLMLGSRRTYLATYYPQSTQYIAN